MTFLITCPNCGPREALEFSFGGETTERAGPTATDRQLAAALYFRRNVDGWQTEWWVHQSGCLAWFLAERHTTTNEIRRTYRPEDRRVAHEPAGHGPGEPAQGDPGSGREATLA